MKHFHVVNISKYSKLGWPCCKLPRLVTHNLFEHSIAMFILCGQGCQVKSVKRQAKQGKARQGKAKQAKQSNKSKADRAKQSKKDRRTKQKNKAKEQSQTAKQKSKAQQCKINAMPCNAVTKNNAKTSKANEQRKKAKQKLQSKAMQSKSRPSKAMQSQAMHRKAIQGKRIVYGRPARVRVNTKESNHNKMQAKSKYNKSFKPVSLNRQTMSERQQQKRKRKNQHERWKGAEGGSKEESRAHRECHRGGATMLGSWHRQQIRPFRVVEAALLLKLMVLVNGGNELVPPRLIVRRAA